MAIGWLVVPGKHTGCGFSCGPFRLEEQHEPWDREALLGANQTAPSHQLQSYSWQSAGLLRFAQLSCLQEAMRRAGVVR